jgi:spore coat polysaccharide biosynthesis protein SpsF
MPNVVLIIQARMGSKRLPGKSMMDLAGMPLVGRILERVKRCKEVNCIVLAIPLGDKDSILGDLGRSMGVNVYQGSENDLLNRYYEAAKLYKADLIVRLPADNPTPEPNEIDRIIKYHISLKKPGFSSNLAEINNSGYPDGIGAEVIDYSLLEQAENNVLDPKKREHVHLNFYDYASKKVADSISCPVNTLLCPKEFRRPDLILDVNTMEQYGFMRELYENLYPKIPNFHITDIINWYDNIYMKNQLNRKADNAIV